MILLPLLLSTGICGNDKASIDSIVKNILEPRHIRQLPVKKSPFVGGNRPLPKTAAPVKKKRAPQLKLQGIVNKKALINGKLYQVGDTVAGYQVQTITENGVTFLKNGMLYAAKLTASGSKIQITRER